MAALAYRDTTSENREFWKNEMGNALREIQATYDEKLEVMRGELETFYNLKVCDISLLKSDIIGGNLSRKYRNIWACMSFFELDRH